jgi:hypothetical protein
MLRAKTLGRCLYFFLGLFWITVITAAAQTQQVTSTVSDICGGAYSQAPYPSYAQSFTYTIPANYSITGATISGTWGSSCWSTSTAGVNISLAGLPVAQCVKPNAGCWAEGAPNRPWSNSNLSSIYTQLATGSAVLTVQQTSETWVEIGSLRLTLTVTPNPTPGIVVTTNPAGRSFTVDGTPYSSAQTFTWITGSSHPVSTTSPQISLNTRYVFANWSDSGAISHTITAPPSATTYTANFTTQYRLTTSVSPASGGTVSVSPTSADGFYDSGTPVQLTATPNANYIFSGWAGDVPYQMNPQTVTMSAPRNVTAIFTFAPPITIQTSPAGLSFTVDGTQYTTARTFNWVPGDRHTVSTATPQISLNTRYVFANWSDSGAISHEITVPSSAATYTANFTTQYRLTTTISPTAGGTISLSPTSADGFYSSGASVQLTATPNANYVFSGWAGDVPLQTNPQTVTMSLPRNVTAIFSSTSGITITTNPPGRTFTVDGTQYTTAQTFTWVAGSNHTVGTTSPQGSGGTRYGFANWSDGGAISHTITAPASPTTYTANFTTQYQLTTAASPASGGTVSANPTSADGYYNTGTSVQLTATPNAGYSFLGWSGDLTGTVNPQSVTMTAPRNVTANFASAPRMTLVPGSLSFGYQVGSGAPGSQVLEVKSSGAALEFSVSVSTDTGGNWLSVMPVNGTTPVNLTVRVNPAGLAAGNYTGKVTVSSAGAGNSPQAAEVSLTVSGTLNPKPAITDLSPKGVVAGGTGFDLQVYGADFMSGSKVRWDGVDLEGETQLSSRQLRVPVPAIRVASAKAVKVTVYTPEPGGGESGVMAFNVSSRPPIVTGLSLQSVIAGRSGYLIGIYGANFLPESIAEWNGSGRPTQFISSGQLTITLQAGDIAAAGTGRITVMNPGGVRSNEKGLEVVALPVGSPEIQRLIPDTVEVGGIGFTLVVQGSGYVAGSVVEWNGQGKVTKYGSGGQLSAEILASDIRDVAESYGVVVRNPGGGASAQGLEPSDTGSGTSNTGVVSKRNPGPEVTGLSPAAVVAGSGGLQLTISGGGYVEGKSVVSWNDIGLASSYVSKTELRVEVPAGYVATEGTATIEVRNPSPGGGSMAKTLTILPSEGAKKVLLYPRLMSVGGAADATESTGIAVANLSTRAAKLTAWAYGKGGEEIRGEQITNPVSVTMSGEEQQAIVDWQVFGESLRQAGRGEGWLKLESTEKQIAGFFMMFNDSLTFLDGANASLEGMQEFVLPEVGDRGETAVYVANPNGASATVTFELRKGDGQQRGVAVQRQANGHGTLAVQLKDLFSGMAAEGGDYVRAVSDRKVVALEYMGEKPKYVYALSGQAVSEGGTILYGAQYAVGGGQYRTTISVVNLDSTAGTVRFRLFNDDGVQIGMTRDLAIRGNGKLQITDQDFFLKAGDELMSGFVEIRSDGPRLTGAIVFGDPGRETMATSLPLATGLMTAMVFGHVVSNATWWTGVTLVNPGATDAVATVELYDRMGTLVRSKQERIKAGGRRIGLLSQYFDGLGNHQGYMKVTSDQGLAGFAIFGTNELSVISAIPPQVLPAD